MPKPSTDDIRRALASLREATAAVAEIHDAESPDDATATTPRAFETAASSAVSDERRCRDVLMGLIADLAGPPPNVVIIDGTVIALTHEGDGMAVVNADQVVRL
jgi:hypothetical protein